MTTSKLMDKFGGVGNSNIPISDCKKISEEEYKKIPNPLVIIGENAIENDLINLANSSTKQR